MTEHFNVDLPPPFRFKKGTQEEKEKQIEEYLRKLLYAIDEAFKRLFNRFST